MRAALLVGLALLGVAAKPASGPVHRCTNASRGFRACTTFVEQSAIYRRNGDIWAQIVGALPGQRGWWRRVVPSSDRKVVLAQWSGECEVQTTHFVAAGGKVRAVFRGHESTIVGWASGGFARVRLDEAIWSGRRKIRRPGIYLVDPQTLSARLERSRPARPGC